MNPLFAPLEKLINEHGSATILKQQLELAAQQYEALERKVDETQKQSAKLEVKFEFEQSKHREITEELQRLKAKHAEEVRIFSTMEFRRGKRTGDEWMPFCPKCQMPLNQRPNDFFIYCPATCGWHGPRVNQLFSQLIKQIK